MNKNNPLYSVSHLKTFSELEKLGRSPIDNIKVLRELERLGRAINTEPPFLKALREQREMLGHIISIKPDFIKAIEKQQEDFARLINTEPTIPKILCAQHEIMNCIINLQPYSSLNIFNKQQEVLSRHPLFRSLESIKNEDLELKEQANKATSQIASFLNSKEKQTLEESLSAHSLASWLSPVFILYYTVRELAINSSNVDSSLQPLMQENINNIQSLISVTTSSTMFHFLISLRRNHRLGELLAQ